MKRKLIKQGSGGLTICLPRKWTEGRHLKAGDEIEVEEEESGLLISSEKTNMKKEFRIDLIPKDEATIRIKLNNIYRAGHDKIIVNLKEKGQEEIVEKIVHEMLLGFEITSKKNNLMVIENVAEPSGEKQDVLMRRIFFLSIDSLEIQSKNIEEGTMSDLNKILSNNAKIDEYINFCRRNIITKRYTSQKINQYWSITSNLIVNHHNITYFYKQFKNKPKVKFASEVVTLSKEINKLFYNLYENFYQHDINNLSEKNRKIRALIQEKTIPLFKLTKGDSSIALYYLNEQLRVLSLLTANMIAVEL